MKSLLLLALTFWAFTTLSQPKWAFKRPTSESQRFYYFNGEGSTKDDAYLNAVQSMLQEIGEIEAIGETSKAVEVTEDMRKSKFATTTSVTIGTKKFLIFPVAYEQDGGTHYALIGTPRAGTRTDGGVMSKGNFIWRSSLVPGWGQFYNREPSKGLVFSIGEVALIGATIYSFSEASSQEELANLALLNGNLAQYSTYNQNVKTWNTAGTILGIGAIAYWVLNIVDATASEKNLYVFDKPMKLNMVATNTHVGLTLSF